MDILKFIAVYALSAVAAMIALAVLIKKELPSGSSVGFLLVGIIVGLLAASGYFFLSLR